MEHSEFCTVSRQIRFVASHIYNIGILFMKPWSMIRMSMALVLLLLRLRFCFNTTASLFIVKLRFSMCECDAKMVSILFHIRFVLLPLLFFSFYFHLSVQCEPIYSNFAERAHVSPFVHVR